MMQTMRVHRAARRAIAGVAAAAAAFVAAASQPVAANDADEIFFKGKTLPIMIGFPPGGSYDTYARLVVAHLGRYIPGNPTFVVQHKPSGIGVLRQFYDTAPRDGSMIGIFPETIAIMQLTQPDIGKWRVQDMAYVGSFADVNAALIVRKGAPAETVEQMRTAPVTVGCNNPLGVSYINPIIMKNLGGFPFKIVCGYPGTNSFPVALARGEIDMVSGAWTAWKIRSEVQDGTWKPVIQSGLKRHKDLQDVPLMQDLIADAEGKKVAEFLSAGSAIGRALLLPPGVPQERIKIFRTAFDKMVRDPAFLEDAARASAEIDPTSGVETQKTSDSILGTPQGIVARANEVTK